MRYRSAFPALLAIWCALFSSACIAILGGFDFNGKPTGDVGGSGGAGATSTSSSTSAAGGNGGGSACQPGEMKACYAGPDGTDGVGVCKAGMQACASDGLAWGACAGQVTPKQETCADPEDEDCDGRECVEWAEVFGDSAMQVFGAVAADAQGNIVVAGDFSGSINLGAGVMLKASGSTDVLVMKLTPSGNAVWGRALGDAGEQSAHTVAVDSTGDIVVGGATQTALTLGDSTVAPGLFIAKIAGDDGHIIWAKGLGGGACSFALDAAVRALAVTSQNDVAVAGSFCGDIDFGDGALSSTQGSQDAFVAVLRGADGSGKVSDGFWGVRFGDDKAQEADSIGITSLGQLVVAGTFEGNIELDGGAISKGGYDIFVAQFWGSPGMAYSLRTYGDAADQHVASIVVAADGGYVVAGHFAGELDFGGMPIVSDPNSGRDLFVARLNASGQPQWARSFVSGGMSYAPMVFNAVGATAGSIVVTGIFGGTLDLGGVEFDAGMRIDMFLTKLDDTGQTLWAKQFQGGTGFTISGGVASATPTGEVVLAGALSNETDFGTGLLTPAGTDAFVAKFGL